MKKLVSAVLIACQAVTFAAPAMAQEIDVSKLVVPELRLDEPDVGAAVSPMKKGQVAPFTGVLLSPRAVAGIVTQLNSFDEQVAIEVDRAKAQVAARCTLDLSDASARCAATEKILNARIASQGTEVKRLTGLLEKHEKKAPARLWISLGCGAGFIFGVGLTVLTTYAVNQASK